MISAHCYPCSAKITKIRVRRFSSWKRWYNHWCPAAAAGEHYLTSAMHHPDESRAFSGAGCILHVRVCDVSIQVVRLSKPLLVAGGGPLCED